eukprot:scaffold1307_cov200-Pinguiococcus_pyrenoidosus.AAC.157
MASNNLRITQPPRISTSTSHFHFHFHVRFHLALPRPLPLRYGSLRKKASNGIYIDCLRLSNTRLRHVLPHYHDRSQGCLWASHAPTKSSADLLHPGNKVFPVCQ